MGLLVGNFWRPSSLLRHCVRASSLTAQRPRSGHTEQSEPKSCYDAVIIGSGHNGLISAAYLQKAGLSVCVLERRHVIGGAAVTEEIIPGYKFSRASYLLSLLRPQIISDLELKKYGLKVYFRDPSSYTPLIEPGGKGGKARSLTIFRDAQKTANQIAQFSAKDAQAFAAYESQLERIVAAVDPLLDSPPPNLTQLLKSNSLRGKLKLVSAIKPLLWAGKSLDDDFPAFYEFMTSPATKILDKWFESEPLKATLATDSVIGAMISPKMPGSGYVLLHHMMGGVEGVAGAWGYVEGGMGAVSQAIASSAMDHGAQVFTRKTVSEILTNRQGETTGILLDNGMEIQAKMVLSNATPKVTFLDLLPPGALPEELTNEISTIDYTSPVTKINVAVDKIPNFLADPNSGDNVIMPHHQATIHINCEDTELIHEAYTDAQRGTTSNKPMMEMVIPSSLDPTIAPPGGHVVLLFTQYTPYKLADGEWDEAAKNKYADTVFASIEQYAPGFTASVVGRDILTPPDLERTFGITGGNIFHGALSLDQLYQMRPVPVLCNYRSPITGLYLCGSGAHPGGGVVGSAGRLAAMEALKDWKSLNKLGKRRGAN